MWPIWKSAPKNHRRNNSPTTRINFSLQKSTRHQDAFTATWRPRGAEATKTEAQGKRASKHKKNKQKKMPQGQFNCSIANRARAKASKNHSPLLLQVFVNFLPENQWLRKTPLWELGRQKCLKPPRTFLEGFIVDNIGTFCVRHVLRD